MFFFFLRKKEIFLKDIVTENIINQTNSFSPNRTHYIPRTSFDDKNYFKCVICVKKFENKEKLRQHLRKHINSKPYNCLNCNKKFIKKTHLDIHINSMCPNSKKMNVALPDSINVFNSENSMQTSPYSSSSPSPMSEYQTSDDNMLKITNSLDTHIKIASANTSNSSDIIWFNPMEFIKNNYRRY